MVKIKFLLAIFLSTTLWLQALPQEISSFVNKSKIPSKDISIYIKEVGTNNVIASLNANTVRKPASVIKVMTTYAALLKLGFDYRWPTKFYMSGRKSGSTLKGDLIVKGFGDPTLSESDLDSIVKQIKNYGIRHITGNIVIDRSYFSVKNTNSSHFDNNTYSPYNAMPDAMMFNERTSTVCITPKNKSAHKELNDPSYKLVNNIKFVNKSCKGQYSWAGSKVDESGTDPKLILSGKISKRCGKRKVCKVVTKPYKAFYYVLKDRLKDNGVSVKGSLRLKKVPRNSQLLFTHYSKSLEQIVSKTAKKSNNLYARHLMLFLGAKVYGAPSTIEKGRKAINLILKQKGVLNRNRHYIDNGSGLSRSSKMSAKTFADMYESAYLHYGQRWMNTLSIAGEDGTIKKRFRNAPAKNRAWMKTGTLNNVKNIGGYVKNRKGTLYSVVIIVNTKQARWRAAALQNNIINWLASTKNTPTAKKKYIKQSSSSLSNGKYFIQVGSYSKEPNREYKNRIKNLKLSYKIEYTSQYKVLIGPYKDKNSASRALLVVRNNLNTGAFLVDRSK